MAIPKRLTAQRKVVSRFDPSWREIVAQHDTAQTYADYCNRLDIELIDNPLGRDNPFTVFTVVPLQTRFEMFVDGESSNWWEIFRHHVKGISGMEIESQDGAILEKHREDIGPVFVQDIARMIVDMASIDGVSCFFTIPGGCWAFTQNCRRHHASAMEAAVRGAAARLKHSASEPSPAQE